MSIIFVFASIIHINVSAIVFNPIRRLSMTVRDKVAVKMEHDVCRIEPFVRTHPSVFVLHAFTAHDVTFKRVFSDCCWMLFSDTIFDPILTSLSKGPLWKSALNWWRSWLLLVSWTVPYRFCDRTTIKNYVTNDFGDQPTTSECSMSFNWLLVASIVACGQMVNCMSIHWKNLNSVQKNDFLHEEKWRNDSICDLCTDCLLNRHNDHRFHSSSRATHEIVCSRNTNLPYGYGSHRFTPFSTGVERPQLRVRFDFLLWWR